MPEDFENPYAPLSNPDPIGYEPTGQVFHKGKLLVVHKRAVLPDRCVKSNEPTQERLRRKLNWHNPSLYILILLSPLIYALVAFIVRKKAVFDIPLAARYKSARIKWMITAWLIFLGSVGLFILGNETPPGENTLSALCVIQFPIAILTSLLIGLFGCRVVYVTKIDDQYAWIGGTCEEFRQSFPEWPGPGK